MEINSDINCDRTILERAKNEHNKTAAGCVLRIKPSAGNETGLVAEAARHHRAAQYIEKELEPVHKLVREQ
ncbi:hypothetical protein HY404_03065 [Candidatus Microgenomates bacterium]|nr:hypothetical protein [Candidatus Microgenomates bacterium]